MHCALCGRVWANSLGKSALSIVSIASDYELTLSVMHGMGILPHRPIQFFFPTR